MAGFPGNRMPQWQKTFFALVILFTSGCRGWGGGTDTVEILSEKPSPDGRFIATSFYCEGGGAAGYCYWNADLRRAEDELNQRDGLLGKHKTWKGFGDIKLRWIDNGNLEIAYKQANSEAYRDHVSERVESRHGIRIHYIVTN
tara:strand:+ start:569 stop:997 length:429 start_codon:yes stop_codon:yes gene_type:complete